MEKIETESVSNPFRQTPEEMIASLRATCATFREFGGNGGLVLPTDDRILELERSAPQWPEGELMFLGLYLRMCTGSENVDLSWQARAAHLRATGLADPLKDLGDFGLTGRAIRVLGTDEGYSPGVDWITLDLAANRKRSSIANLQRDRGSYTGEVETVAGLELIDLLWLFPDYWKQVDGDTLPFPVAGGCTFEHKDYGTVTPYFGRITRREPGFWPALLNLLSVKNSAPRFSVPTMRICR